MNPADMTDVNDSLVLADAAPSRRRTWLLAAAGAVAALAGAGVAWRAYRPETLAPRVEDVLWALDFAAPTGGERLRLADFRGKPLLLNFWATWCPPCIEELPLLSDFYRENAAKGWQVLGIAVDQVGSVNRFLANSPVPFPVVMAGVAGMDLVKLLGNQQGGLPFTVVLGADGRVAQRKIGKLSADDLRDWSVAVAV